MLQAELLAVWANAAMVPRRQPAAACGVLRTADAAGASGCGTRRQVRHLRRPPLRRPPHSHRGGAFSTAIKLYLALLQLYSILSVLGAEPCTDSRQYTRKAARNQATRVRWPVVTPFPPQKHLKIRNRSRQHCLMMRFV